MVGALAFNDWIEVHAALSSVIRDDRAFAEAVKTVWSGVPAITTSVVDRARDGAAEAREELASYAQLLWAQKVKFASIHDCEKEWVEQSRHDGVVLWVCQQTGEISQTVPRALKSARERSRKSQSLASLQLSLKIAQEHFDESLNLLQTLLSDAPCLPLSFCPAPEFKVAILDSTRLKTSRKKPSSRHSGRNTTSIQGKRDIDDASGIPKCLTEVEGLRSVFLDHCGLLSFPDRLCSVPGLLSLCLDHNSVSLPSEVGCLTTLQELSITHNGMSKLSMNVGSLTALQTLDLRHNMLTTLPSGFSFNLKSLSLYFALCITRLNRQAACPPDLELV
jgi:hypothetical protein